MQIAKEFTSHHAPRSLHIIEFVPALNGLIPSGLSSGALGTKGGSVTATNLSLSVRFVRGHGPAIHCIAPIC
jgi:hypothetical protein